MFAAIIQIKEIWFQVVYMQVQATRGTLLIVMIYFRDSHSGNFMWNQGVPPQSVAFDLKRKTDKERYFVCEIVWISLSITIPGPQSMFIMQKVQSKHCCRSVPFYVVVNCNDHHQGEKNSNFSMLTSVC